MIQPINHLLVGTKAIRRVEVLNTLYSLLVERLAARRGVEVKVPWNALVIPEQEGFELVYLPISRRCLHH